MPVATHSGRFCVTRTGRVSRYAHWSGLALRALVGSSATHTSRPAPRILRSCIGPQNGHFPSVACWVASDRTRAFVNGRLDADCCECELILVFSHNTIIGHFLPIHQYWYSWPLLTRSGWRLRALSRA